MRNRFKFNGDEVSGAKAKAERVKAIAEEAGASIVFAEGHFTIHDFSDIHRGGDLEECWDDPLGHGFSASTLEEDPVTESDDAMAESFWKSLDDDHDHNLASQGNRPPCATSSLFQYEADANGLCDAVLDAIQDIEEGNVTDIDGVISVIENAFEALFEKPRESELKQRAMRPQGLIPLQSITEQQAMGPRGLNLRLSTDVNQQSSCGSAGASSSSSLLPVSSCSLVGCSPPLYSTQEVSEPSSSHHSEEPLDLLSEANLAFLFDHTCDKQVRQRALSSPAHVRILALRERVLARLNAA